MIRLTRLNGAPLYLNSDLIEHIDPTPDTVLTLTSGAKFLVLESPEDVCEKMIAFRKSCAPAYVLPHASDPRLASVDVAHG